MVWGIFNFGVIVLREAQCDHAKVNGTGDSPAARA